MFMDDDDIVLGLTCLTLRLKHIIVGFSIWSTAHTRQKYSCDSEFQMKTSPGVWLTLDVHGIFTHALSVMKLFFNNGLKSKETQITSENTYSLWFKMLCIVIQGVSLLYDSMFYLTGVIIFTDVMQMNEPVSPLQDWKFRSCTPREIS